MEVPCGPHVAGSSVKERDAYWLPTLVCVRQEYSLQNLQLSLQFGEYAFVVQVAPRAALRSPSSVLLSVRNLHMQVSQHDVMAALYIRKA